MKKTIFYSLFSALFMLTSCSMFEIDNYEEPAETIWGEVVDEATGKRVLTDQGSEGIRVRLTELSWGDNVQHNPDFYCMMDGTFQNTKIFKGEYNVRIDGPFIPLVRENTDGTLLHDGSVNTEISGTTKVKFEVQPFLNVEFVGNPQVSNGVIKAQVRVTRGVSDGKNTWYWDSPLNADVRYETFISNELVKYVDSHYKTVADRKGRAITGLSMGGHGAMWNGLRHSDVFSAAGSTSGGVDIRPFPKNWEMSVQIGEKAKYPENWEKYTVINLVPTLRKDQIALIFDCGDSDFFLEVNKNYHEALLKQGIDHDFITRPGNHDSQYWNNSIDYQILFFWKHFLKMKAL